MVPRLAGFALLASAIVLAGCAETTTIKTNPPGAKVWLFGQYLGESPVVKDFPNVEWTRALWENKNEMPFKLQLDGYETKEGRIPIRVSARRIWSMTNTVFIPYLTGRRFRPPRDEYEFDLVQVGGAARPGEDLLPADVRQRLHKLESLRDQGAITKSDYEALRLQVLKDALIPAAHDNDAPR